MKSQFSRDFCRDGRAYLLGRDLYKRYTATDKIIKTIKENIRGYIFVDASVRITLDSNHSDPERAIFSLPCNADDSGIVGNLADMIYTNMQAYYGIADPRIKHYGIANTIMEGFDSSGLRRELELVCKRVATRPDIASKVIKNIEFEADKLPHTKEFMFSDVFKEHLDIHLGYRILLYGEKMNPTSFFIPVSGGAMIIQQIYYNMEILLHHNLVAYDEIAEQGYLRLSDSLLLKEVAALLKRIKNKENVRKKLINNIKFSTVVTDDPVKKYGEVAGDYVWDTVNQIDSPALIDASDRSKALYDTLAIRTARYVDDTIDFKKFADFSVFINKASDPTADNKEKRDNESQVVEKVAARPTEKVAAAQPTEEEKPADSEISTSLDDDMTVDEI